MNFSFLMNKATGTQSGYVVLLILHGKIYYIYYIYKYTFPFTC